MNESKKSNIVFAIIVIGLVVAAVIGMFEIYAQQEKNFPDNSGHVEKVSIEYTIEHVTDYGMGVYHISATGANYANCLAAFRDAHPELIQTSQTFDGRKGYFVTFEPRPAGTLILG